MLRKDIEKEKQRELSSAKTKDAQWLLHADAAKCPPTS